MNRIAEFKKVSFEQFLADIRLEESEARKIYDDIKIPARSTSRSAGYDFYSPIAFTLKPGESILVPTGIRAKIDDGYVLMIFPRSSLGFKYRLQLDNTSGIIDADYFDSKNEGHIMCKVTNCSYENKEVSILQNEKFCQGLFIPFGITMDDNVTSVRIGGLGSTGRK